MATLDDLKDVLESIDRSMIEQKDLLTNMFNIQETRNRLSSVDTTISTTSTGQGIGSAAAGIGQGIGSAATGLGIGGLLGLGALSIFANFDAEAIKENVVTLLSISDEVGGKAEFFKEGGTFFATMTGIGIGLAAFGIGQGAVSLAQWISDPNWTKILKANVIDLFSLADEVGDNIDMLFVSGSLFAALYGIGAGLKAFGIGQILVGFGQWLTDTKWAETVKENVITLISIGDIDGIKDFTTINFAGAMISLATGVGAFAVGNAAIGLTQFISPDAWAQRVKDNVATLLSIAELPGMKDFTTVNFVGAMALLATGLTVFAIGKAGTTIVDGAADALKYFTSSESFAEKIKSEVKTLLSIAELPGMKDFTTTNFVGAMTLLATGLAVFAVGKGGAVVVDGVAEALKYFTGSEEFAEKIKSEVKTLLSIPGLAVSGSADEFVKTMSKLSFGLMAFAGGNLVGTLINATSAIFSFFRGVDTPFEQIRLIAADADNLVKAADALEKLAIALEKFGNINVNVGDINFEKLAKNLGESIPLLYRLANGGIYNPIGPMNEIDFGPEAVGKGGILNPSLRLDEIAAMIAKVNYVLGQATTYPVGQTSATTAVEAPGNARLTESVAAAVAESQLVSITAENVRIETENATINRFQAQAEVLKGYDMDKRSQVNMTDASTKTDARQNNKFTTYNSVTSLSPSTTKGDLDYYFAN